MTTLQLSDTPPGDPVGSLVSRIKWSVIAPWLVTAAMFGANGYHRFLSGEAARESDTHQIQALSREVAELKQDMAVLKAILYRMEAQQSADILRNNRRGR